MKRIFTFIFALLILTGLGKDIYAQDNGFGLGAMLGEPTGFSGKYWINETNAADFGLAYSFIGSHSSVSLHADYLYHVEDVIKSNYRLPLYYGFGARIRFVNNADNSFGARGVIGLVWMHDTLPIDVFGELAPVFNLLPSTSLNFDAAIGARYYFK